MHWPIQAAVLFLCIVTCAAQTRGSRRFSSSTPTSIQESIAEEDVVLKNHRFQTRNGGTRAEIRANEVSTGRDYAARQSNRRESEVATSTRRSRGGDNSNNNDITRTPTRISSRQRAEQSPTPRQYLSRNSRPADPVTRRRIDTDISTEEVSTRASIRPRTERIRTSYTSRGSLEPESPTTAQYRGRDISSRDKDNSQHERPASQIRSRNGNVRTTESNQSRSGRGKSLSLEEPITHSPRTRGRILDETTAGHSRVANVRNSESRLNGNRVHDGTRGGSYRGTVNDHLESEIAHLPRAKGRNIGRTRTAIRTESPPYQVIDKLSTKPIEEVPVASSEIPIELSSQNQLNNAEVTQSLADHPVKQPVFQEVPSEETLIEESKKKVDELSDIPIESTVAAIEERVLASTKLSTERTTRTPGRGRVRGRQNEIRNSGLDYDTATRSSGRRNSQRFTSRPLTSASSDSIERPNNEPINEHHYTGRGRTREYVARSDLSRNGRTEVDGTTASYRGRNNLNNPNNVQASSTSRIIPPEEHTASYETASAALPAADKTINEDLPTVVESEVNKVVSADSEVQVNSDYLTTSSPTTKLKPTASSNSPINNSGLVARKSGRGSFRASNSEVISCTCYTIDDCNVVNCPQV